MKAYDPTDDILRFHDFRPPWIRVECEEQLRDGVRIRAIAFNSRDGLVLFHNLAGPHIDCALSVYRSSAPDGPYGEEVEGYENIWHFDACWNKDANA